jgi:hypothetical protein
MPIPEQNSPALKRFVADISPAVVRIKNPEIYEHEFMWSHHDSVPSDRRGQPILETEWLYIISLVEQQLSKELKYNMNSERNRYVYELSQNQGSLGACMSDFNQRATALARVKGVTIEL